MARYKRRDSCRQEAEDFMCDQVIFATEVDFQRKRSSIQISTTKLRVAIEILANTLLPTVSTVYYAYMRNQKCVVENVRKILIPTILAVLANYLSQSLSSVQRRISPRLLEPIENTHDETPEPSVECKILSDPSNIKADIIFIHGLHGAINKTWRRGMWLHERHKINRQELTKTPSLGDIRCSRRRNHLKRPIKSADNFVVLNKISKSCVNSSVNSINNSFMEDDSQDEQKHLQDEEGCWPLWLQNDFPGGRVIAVNYTTDPHLWRPLWVKKRNRTGLTERSKEMIDQLRVIGVGEYPIIWVGHSKGGLYIKQILIDCSDNQETRRIYEQTKAILFYSVPHRGSIMADISIPLLSKSIEVIEVQKNCKFVLELHDKFLKLFEDDENFKPEVFSFIETSFTLMAFIYLKIVSIESADPGIGEICEVPLDHREICKPTGRDCFLYQELINLIRKALGDDSRIESGLVQ